MNAYGIKLKHTLYRLKSQGEAATERIGFLIHPQIPQSSPDLKFADVCTGSGSWLMEVARTLPSTCSFTGFDISANIFPAESSLPRNVDFRTHSVLDPFPGEDRGTYDVVAVRFCLLAFHSAAEWKIAVENLVSLLKPGGWLQWLDSDLTKQKCCQSRLGTSRAALEEIMRGFCEDFCDESGILRGGITMLPKLCREAGLVDVQDETFSTDKDSTTREESTRSIVMGFKPVVLRLAKSGHENWNEEKLEKLLKDAECDISHGVYITHNSVCVIGRKRLDHIKMQDALAPHGTVYRNLE